MKGIKSNHLYACIFRQERNVYLFFGIAMGLCIFPEFINFDPSRWCRPRNLCSFLFMFSGITLLAYYFNRLAIKILAIIFFLAVALNMGIMTSCLYVWKCEFTTSEFLAMLNTTTSEAAPMVLSVLPYALLTAGYFASTLALTIWGHRVLRGAKRRISLRNGAYLLLGLACALVLWWSIFLVDLQKDSQAYKRISHLTPLYCASSMVSGLEILHQMGDVRDLALTTTAPGVMPNSTRNIIVILGESARRDALAIYGQPYETTPFASARIKNMLIYDSAIAPAAHTLQAVPPLLCATPPATTIAPNDMANNILNLANLSDCWETYWISNQGKFGLNDSEIGVIAEFARHQWWMSPTYRPDGVLLPYLDSALSDQAPKRLIFLHLCGSHARTNERYPAEFAYFDLPDQELSNYLNSVRYTDYFIEEVIRRVEQTPSIVLYLSDHGQARVDGKFVHSRTQKGVEVPYFIWHSDGVDSLFQQTGRITQPTSTATLFETMKFYLGLQTADHKPEDPNLTIRTPEALIPYRNLPPGQ